MVPPSCVDYAPKLRVLKLAIGHWPEMAKKREEPRKRTHTSETENFCGGSCSLGILVICLVDKNRDSNTKKVAFWPQISKFWGQNCTFSSLAANLSRIGQCFQQGKGVSLVSWYEDTKSFTPSPPKNGLLAQKRHFGPNTGIFGPFDLMPDQKNIGASWTPICFIY